MPTIFGGWTPVPACTSSPTWTAGAAAGGTAGGAAGCGAWAVTATAGPAVPGRGGAELGREVCTAATVPVAAGAPGAGALSAPAGGASRGGLRAPRAPIGGRGSPVAVAGAA